METLIITFTVALGLLFAIPVYRLASGKNMSESFSVFTGMLQKVQSSPTSTPIPQPRQTPSWLKTGFNKILSFIGFLVATGVTVYFIMWIFGHGMKTIHEITKRENEKSSQSSVISIGVPKTLHFKSEDEAEFEFIAQPGMIINFDYFPCDGEIITSKGRYKIGPSYGYKGVPGGNQNTYWKCVTLGNPFEAKIFISKDSLISKN